MKTYNFEEARAAMTGKTFRYGAYGVSLHTGAIEKIEHTTVRREGRTREAVKVTFKNKEGRFDYTLPLAWVPDLVAEGRYKDYEKFVMLF